MRKLTSIALLLVGVLLSGCAATNITKFTQALAKDPAIVNMSVTSIYGNVKFTRIGSIATNESVTISPDGTTTVKNQ